MSISLLIALTSYCLGALLQWLQLQENLYEFDEYINFPIVWAAKVVTISGCVIKALLWPYCLILNE
jgi:hypothetical protein